MTFVEWLGTFTAAEAVWSIGLIAGALFRIPFEIAKRRRKVVHSRTDALDVALLVLFVLFLVGLPSLILNSSFCAWANWRHPNALPLIAGTALMLAALGMIVRVHIELGAGWSGSLRIREGQTLVTTGIYSRVRHPMYAAGLLVALAQLLLLENWVAGLGGFLAMAGIVFVRIPREEAMMRDWYGKAYEDYMRHTGAIFPRFRR